MSASSSSRGLRPLAAAAFLACSLAASHAQSDSAETPDDQPGDSAGHKSSLSPFLPATNAVSSSFMDSHPELEQPPPALPAPTLSSHSTSAPPPDADQSEAPVDRFAFPNGSPDELGEHLLVVYNSADPASQPLAEYYASRRQIPTERVLGISCPTVEQITRRQYEETVHAPILSYILSRNWMTRRTVSIKVGGQPRDLQLTSRNDIWAIVLMRGIPLRIAFDPTLKGSMENVAALLNNAAAVDSELSLLPISGLPAGGFAPNIFFDRTGSGLLRAGPELATKIVLVTRLDGPRPADVRRMIDDTLYAEQNRLAGLAVIDSRGIPKGSSNYAVGDDWLRNAHEMLMRDGWDVKFDSKPEVLPASDPLNHVAIYLGWYHDGACGPWITAPNRFARGAIAYHLHSFSATSVRSATVGWVGPLIAHGASATMGCVYEPYLDLTPHLDIFMHRLLQGNSFAEAAYASEPGLSWMVTVVGDPLYHPFDKSVDSVLAGSSETASDHYGWLLLQQTNRILVRNEVTQDVPTLQHYLNVPGAVAQEGLGDLLAKLGDPASEEAAIGAYREAASLDVQPVDRIRVGMKLAQEYGREEKDDEQQTELRTLHDLFPAESITFAVPDLPGAPLGAVNQSTANTQTQQPAHVSPASMLRPPQPPRPPRPTIPISDTP